MRVAIIDLGTNTFNLLIADVHPDGFNIVHKSKEGVALGMGGINECRIAPDAIERALTAIAHFSGICSSMRTDVIRAIGTSAMRDASNAQELTDAVFERFGIQVEIIDGMEEARLIYEGVRWSWDFEQPSLIMDIGGGSTEFIRGYRQEPLQSCSLNIGVSRAVQLFQLEDPLSEADCTKLIQWFESQAAPLNDFQECHTLIGASGSFETFYEMVHEEGFPPGIQPIRLDRKELEDILDWIIRSTFAEREAHPFILPIRRRMAPVAAVKTRWILNRFDIREIVISPCALKEGALRV